MRYWAADIICRRCASVPRDASRLAHLRQLSRCPMPSRLQVIAGIQHCDAVRVESRMLYISSKPGANHERWWQRCLIAISRFPNHYGLLSTDRCLQLAGNDWKTVGPDGRRMDVKGAIPDLDWIAWAGRRVVIAYMMPMRSPKNSSASPGQHWHPNCEAVMPLSAFWNGMSTQVKGSMIILRLSAPRWSWTRSDIWTSRAQHGRGMCCVQSRL